MRRGTPFRHTLGGSPAFLPETYSNQEAGREGGRPGYPSFSARNPLTLSMLMFDSSGTNKEGARTEHREALSAVVEAAQLPEADPMAATCALDWLLYDWLMAHRDGEDSAEIVFPKGYEDAAGMVVAAAAASVAARATFDPGLVLTGWRAHG